MQSYSVLFDDRTANIDFAVIKEIYCEKKNRDKEQEKEKEKDKERAKEKKTKRERKIKRERGIRGRLWWSERHSHWSR